MEGYTKNSKIRHIKGILEKNARKANERYLQALSNNTYDNGDQHKGERFAYELSIMLLKDLLTGLTYDPEEGNHEDVTG